jgi:hypothetical protein
MDKHILAVYRLLLLGQCEVKDAGLFSEFISKHDIKSGGFLCTVNLKYRDGLCHWSHRSK